MQHVIVEPGVCGLTADVKAETVDGMQVKLAVETKCKAINKLLAELGDEVNPYEFLGVGGGAPVLETMRSSYPIHAACPTLAGICKCVEAEAHLALPRDASIRFVEE